MCTVVYFDDCVSIRQCKQYCESMGGSKYRWFHNACCQCIGPECVDYGSKAVKCMNCLFWSAGTRWYQMSGFIPVDWGQRKLWLLCVSIPQLPCKIPPYTAPSTPANCFYSAVMFHCIFLDTFSIVFFFVVFLLEVYMNNVFLQLWSAKFHSRAK